MSYREFHKGKLKILTHNTKETLDYINKNNLENVIKEISYCYETIFEVDSKYEDKYVVLTGAFDGINCEYMLCEYIEHIEQKGGGHDTIDVKRVGYDEYEFLCIFYNGGTCLEEILSDEINKSITKEWNPNEDKIAITARESYMILDMANYILENCPDEYLCCNYSKDEIAKLGQRFGDLNMKNNW